MEDLAFGKNGRYAESCEGFYCGLVVIVTRERERESVDKFVNSRK